MKSKQRNQPKPAPAKAPRPLTAEEVRSIAGGPEIRNGGGTVTDEP